MTTITILPGAKGIKDTYKQALEAEKIDIICLSKNYEEIIGDFFTKEVAPQLRKKDIREVVPNTADNQIYQREEQSDSYKIGLLKSSDRSEADMMITDSAVYFISFNREQPYGLISKDPEMIKQMKIQFEEVWGNCTR